MSKVNVRFSYNIFRNAILEDTTSYRETNISLKYKVIWF